MDTRIFATADARQNAAAAAVAWQADPSLTIMVDGAGRYAVGPYPSMGEDLEAFMSPEEWEWLEVDPEDLAGERGQA
jgi:hypothetical protein